ncbi:MAG: hypothetical protein H6642_12475 [Caldilineaceae bacterium]|nr:hypothetical protein [Caldilineaceae bacterium]
MRVFNLAPLLLFFLIGGVVLAPASPALAQGGTVTPPMDLYEPTVNTGVYASLPEFEGINAFDGAGAPDDSAGSVAVNDDGIIGVHFGNQVDSYNGNTALDGTNVVFLNPDFTPAASWTMSNSGDPGGAPGYKFEGIDAMADNTFIYLGSHQRVYQAFPDGTRTYVYSSGNPISSTSVSWSIVAHPTDPKIFYIGGNYGVRKVNVDTKAVVAGFSYTNIATTVKPSIMKFAPDGNLIVGGDGYGLRKLNPDTGGVVLDYPGIPNNVYPADVAFQGDGKVIVVGALGTGTYTYMLRLDGVTGAVDTTFSPQKSLYWDNSTTSYKGSALAVEVSGNDDIFLGGNFTNVDPNGLGAGSNQHPIGGIVKFDADGNLDEAFMRATQGFADSTNGQMNGYIQDLQIQTDGKLLVAGQYVGLQNLPQHSIIRIHQTGIADTPINNTAANLAADLGVATTDPLVTGAATSTPGYGKGAPGLNSLVTGNKAYIWRQGEESLYNKPGYHPDYYGRANDGQVWPQPLSEYSPMGDKWATGVTAGIAQNRRLDVFNTDGSLAWRLTSGMGTLYDLDGHGGVNLVAGLFGDVTTAGSIKLYDKDTGTEVRTITLDAGARTNVFDVQFSPSGKYIYTLSWVHGNELHRYDVATGAYLGKVTIPASINLDDGAARAPGLRFFSETDFYILQGSAYGLYKLEMSTADATSATLDTVFGPAGQGFYERVSDDDGLDYSNTNRGGPSDDWTVGLDGNVYIYGYMGNDTLAGGSGQHIDGGYHISRYGSVGVDVDPDFISVNSVGGTGSATGITVANPDSIAWGTGGDTDGDNIPDGYDWDIDNDGIPNPMECATSPDPYCDTDGDGITDDYDLDSDNDGILDVVEAGHGGTDADGDGRVDGPVGDDGIPDEVQTGLDPNGQDSNNDGVPDVDYTPVDTDGDGAPDFQDLDSDNDGINDVIESNGTDANGDGMADDPVDANGIPGSVPNGGATPPDTDGDGVPDQLDLDSDNDGINDVLEGPHPGADTNGDGMVDGPDTDGDGIMDPADGLPNDFGDANDPVTPDTDGDGVPDYNDLDSDNDGINDVVEGPHPDGDTNGDGMIDGPDTDGDGIQDPADGAPATFGDANDPGAPNTDNDDTPDYQDLDSNGDNTTDLEEGGLDPTVLDPDGDGVVNCTTNCDPDGDGILAPVDGDPTNYGDAIDTDGDGVPDSVDLDDDNDGIPDIVEDAATCATMTDIPFASDDCDGDGVPNRLDLDSDNDGINDVEESSGDDPDGDGIIGTGPITDVDGDGLHDPVDYIDSGSGVGEVTGGTQVPMPDPDSDGAPNPYDLDSNGDNTTDLEEGGLDPTVLDPDGDGVVNCTTNCDPDGDGILTPVDGLPNVWSDAIDTDGDGVPDSVDLDDDNDGIPDIVEDAATCATMTDIPFASDDCDGDGVPNRLDLDSDNDGINDVEESSGDDPDGDGIIGTGPITDVDGDGLHDPVDYIDSGSGVGEVTGGTQVPMPDPDSDGAPNPYDLDSNGDNTTDLEEGGLDPTVLDPDGDGVVNCTTNCDPDGDGILTPVDGLPNVWSDAIDTDGDGVPDSVDLDDDNDGIPDIVEDAATCATMTDIPFASDDCDGDGVPNRLDLDSDNDGINDVEESSGDDPDGDGIIGTGPITDVDGDGLHDPVDYIDSGSGAGEVTGGTQVPMLDPDSDGAPNPYDLDSNGDNTTDLEEGGLDPAVLDPDGDGVVNCTTNCDPDGDGILTPVDGLPNVWSDAPIAADGPDLSPDISVTPNIMHGVQGFYVTVRVYEKQGFDTSGLITVKIPKASLWQLDGAYDPGLTGLGSTALNNKDWSYSSDASSHIFQSNAVILGNGFSTFGFNASWDPKGTQGSLNISVVIEAGSGGETFFDNNGDADTVDYFLN